MKILDKEVEFDFLDADNVALFEKEVNTVLDKCKEQKNEKQKLSLSEALRRECEIIEVFFDNMFGEGTSKEIFKGKMNLKEHIKAFEYITSEKLKAQQDLEDTINQYSPNRATRRSNNG